ncbi:beta/gamma crystallin domain-containing protein [Kitasatospora sp. NPDC004240]
MALRKRMTALALAGAAAVTATVATAGPAAAIHRVDQSTCNSRSDFLTIWNYPPKVCFADNGSTGVSIYDVYEVDSGNNRSYHNWYSSATGSSYQTYLGNGGWSSYNPKVKVTWVSIIGR